jgi:signal transduction histidine kinase
MNVYLRYVVLAITAILVALLVAYIGSVGALRESGTDTVLILRYVTISGGVALLLGLVGVAFSMRYMSRLSFKVAFAYGVGSLGAIFTVAYAPLLMFRNQHDLHLLVLMLLCFMVISVGLGSILAVSITQHVNRLREAARAVAAGDYDTRVEVPSGDELSELATAFNTMSAEIGLSFARQRASEQGRRDLVASISHDLRTPLASIRAMIEAIEDGVVTDEATITQYHAGIREQVTWLNRLIDDLLELSRLDAGAMELHVRKLDLYELISETVDSLRPTAEKRNVTLSIVNQADAREAIVDPDQVQRVVANLIQNAVRHTPPGGSVAVNIRSRGSEWAVEVLDTGEGIAVKDMDRIFERFYRGEPSRTRSDDAGAGLGLAIAKAIVEAHAGKIWAENQQPSGTKVVFTLPAAAKLASAFQPNRLVG